MRLLQKAENSNTIISNSFLIFLIRFFPSFATLLVVIFFSRDISQADYGVYQNFWVQLFLLSALGMVGIPFFLLTYSASFVKNLIGKLSVLQYVYLCCWVVVVAIIFACLRVEATSISWFVPFLFFLLYVLNAVVESVLIVFRRFSYLLTINIIYTIAFLLLHYGVLQESYNLNTLFLYLLLPSVCKLLLVAYKLISSLKLINDVADVDYTIKEIRSLWFHIGVYDVIQKVFTWVDKFVISLLFSASVSAVYFNGTFDIPFLPLLLGAVSSAALLQMADLRNKDDVSSTVNIAQQTARILSAVVFPVFFFLFLYRAELFEVLLTNKYEDAVPLFAVAVWVVPLRAYNFTSILQNKHKGRIINIGAVMDLLVACILMYPLYQAFGLLGIAGSFVISSYLQGAYYLHHTSKVLKTPVVQLIPIKNWLAKLVLFGVSFAVIHYVFGLYLSSLFVLVLGSALLLVAVLITLYVEMRYTKHRYG